jgi:hypothetical protein
MEKMALPVENGNTQFRNVPIGGRFRFPKFWLTDHTPIYEKVSTRKYCQVMSDGKTLGDVEINVGTINVNVFYPAE